MPVVRGGKCPRLPADGDLGARILWVHGSLPLLRPPSFPPLNRSVLRVCCAELCTTHTPERLLSRGCSSLPSVTGCPAPVAFLAIASEGADEETPHPCPAGNSSVSGEALPCVHLPDQESRSGSGLCLLPQLPVGKPSLPLCWSSVLPPRPTCKLVGFKPSTVEPPEALRDPLGDQRVPMPPKSDNSSPTSI